MANSFPFPENPSIESLLIIALGVRYNKSLRAKADKALIAIGKPALPAIIAGMKINPTGENSSIEGVDHLGNLTASSTSRLKSVTSSIEAADLLGRIGDPAAIAPLATVMHSAESCYRKFYITALGRIGGESAAKVLVEALQYELDRPAVSRWLVKIGEEAVAPLIAVLGDTNLGNTAAKVLVKIGKPSEEPINNLLNDPNPLVREAAASILKKLTIDHSQENRKVAVKRVRKVAPKKKEEKKVVDYSKEKHIQDAVNVLDGLFERRRIDPTGNKILAIAFLYQSKLSTTVLIGSAGNPIVLDPQENEYNYLWYMLKKIIPNYQPHIIPAHLQVPLGTPITGRQLEAGEPLSVNYINPLLATMLANLLYDENLHNELNPYTCSAISLSGNSVATGESRIALIVKRS